MNYSLEPFANQPKSKPIHSNLKMTSASTNLPTNAFLSQYSPTAFSTSRMQSLQWTSMFPIQTSNLDIHAVNVDELDKSNAASPRLNSPESSPDTAVFETIARLTGYTFEKSFHSLEDLESPGTRYSPSIVPTSPSTLEIKETDSTTAILFSLALISSSSSVLARRIPTNSMEWTTSLGLVILQLIPLWYTLQLKINRTLQPLVWISLLYISQTGQFTLSTDSQPFTLVFLSSIFAIRFISLLSNIPYKTFKVASSWKSTIVPFTSSIGYAILVALVQQSQQWMDNSLVGNPSQDPIILTIWSIFVAFEGITWIISTFRSNSTTILPSSTILVLSLIYLSMSSPLYTLIPYSILIYSIHQFSSSNNPSRFTSLLQSLWISTFLTGIIIGQVALNQLPLAPHPTPLLSPQKQDGHNVAIYTLIRLQTYVLGAASLVFTFLLPSTISIKSHQGRMFWIQSILSITYLLLACFYPSPDNAWNSLQASLPTIILLTIPSATCLGLSFLSQFLEKCVSL